MTHPGGRPITWTPEKRQEAIDRILARIATSRDSIRTICSSDEELPNVDTFYTWMRGNPELAEQYAHAKEAQADVIFEEMLDIADTPQKGTITKTTANGTDVTEEDMLGHRRLQIETRKWILGKVKPKKYGEKLDLNHSGSVDLSLIDRLKEARERAAKSSVNDMEGSGNPVAG